MIFNKSGHLIRKSFSFNDTKLETVRSYKYLGFIVTPSGEIHTGLKDLRDRAMKAFYKLKGAMGAAFHKDIRITQKLIDALIKLYASDFWGCFKIPKNNPIETFHQMTCKQLLGVQKQTTNIAVLLELGQVPICLHAIKAAIKNWERIRLKQAHEYLISSYQQAINDDLPWISNIKNVLVQNGMACFYINLYNDKLPFIHKKVFQRLSDEFHQDAFSVLLRK